MSYSNSNVIDRCEHARRSEEFYRPQQRDIEIIFKPEERQRLVNLGRKLIAIADHRSPYTDRLDVAMVDLLDQVDGLEDAVSDFEEAA